MNLASPGAIQSLFRKYQIRPLKRLGQNFLIDKRVITKLIRAASLKPRDIILEIGPGIGTLTIELAKKVKKVVAVEKDPKLVRVLNNELRLAGIKNVEAVRGDILRIPNSKFRTPNSCKIMGNLPFYLTAPVIRKFLELESPPEEMILVVQKEVGQRICARTPKMNILAVSVQFYAKPEIISYVSRKSFWPSPKVDSAILRIVPLVKADGKLINADLFFKIIKAGFSHPRKQLINNLSKKSNINREKIKDWLLKNNVQPNQRAETLTVKDWLALTKNFNLW
jgi:16S rRNA (adenine1518-N6/adenine1519-N6)-dimethyltransferase